MAGAASHRATTTMKVIDRHDLHPSVYFELISDSLESQGYVTAELLGQPNVSAWMQDLTDELICIADNFPVGTVLERRGDFIGSRKL